MHPIKNLFKLTKIITLFLLIIFALQGCEKNKVLDKKTEREIMTSSILGFAYLEENNLVQAEAEFLHLIEIDPENSAGYTSLGVVYLRMEKYEQAETQLLHAKKIDPKNAHIRILLSDAYTWTNNEDKSENELLEALDFDPDNSEVIYRLSESYAANQAQSEKRKTYLQKLTQLLPANIVPKLDLVEVLLQSGNFEDALINLEEIQQIFPEFPKEAIPSFDQAITYLQSGTPELSIRPVKIFYNYVKITIMYQAGITELIGQKGAMAGFPLVSFDPSAIDDSEETILNILDVIKFKDVTELVGLPVQSTLGGGRLSIEDFDQDGNIDIYYTHESKPSIFINNQGRFADISIEAGFIETGNESKAAFADYDNDGHIDLYIIKDDGNVMYKNSGNRSFDIVPEGKIPSTNTPGSKAIFFDADHDGDLDIYLLKSGINQFLRNNSDGTFSDMPDTFEDANTNSADAVYGDFDNDGDIDLFVVNTDTSNVLYSNLRSGKFENITEKSGLASNDEWKAVTTGDYNNDGFLDLFLTGKNAGQFMLMKNNGDGVFTNSNSVFKGLSNVEGNNAEMFDFDNDGKLDLLVAGSKKGGKGVLLFHNDGSGKFTNVSHLLPDNIVSGKEIGIADFGNDGDLDIFITNTNGGIHLLRNDGGNTNHFLKIKLVGLRKGSRKNNHFGVGAKVEIRAGDLYEMKVATGSEIHFGIGSELRAEVVRIIWTNGVPQNIYFPAGDQFLIEEQLLKGSCPFLYTWNGSEYVFVKDMMWRSALGMPLGIMGGNTQYAFSEPSREHLKIPGEMLQPKDGVYSLQITKELWETIYFDQLELMAVDHPREVTIFVDEKFTPPPFPEFKIFTTKNKHLPISAIDGEGNDLLPSIREKDGKYVSNMKQAKYQGLTETHSLLLDPGKTEKRYVVLNGWIFPTDASINFSISQSSNTEVIPPMLQVINREGNWETIESIGFPMGKNKTIVVDLRNKYLTEDHRIRILTNMQIYWDYVYFTDDESHKINVHQLKMRSANLHYRGYSEMYRKGKYGPHWFDYNAVSTGQKWRDLEGYYTRYGDVMPLLEESDDQYIIANAGDEVTIEFNANLPELPVGWTRDFIIYSVGWVKDGDMNTATGNTVLPLPFHGMSAYPYTEQYPNDSFHINYNKKYNTRYVNSDQFSNTVRNQD